MRSNPFHSSSASSYRLALALLALAGFAAPAAEREVDGVVQTTRTSRATQAELVTFEAPVVEALAIHCSTPLQLAAPASPRIALERRYLLHRAWLL